MLFQGFFEASRWKRRTFQGRRASQLGADTGESAVAFQGLFQSCHGYSDSTAWWRYRMIEMHKHFKTVSRKMRIPYFGLPSSTSITSPGESWSLLCQQSITPQDAHIGLPVSLSICAACGHGCMCNLLLARWRLKPLGRVWGYFRAARGAWIHVHKIGELIHVDPIWSCLSWYGCFLGKDDHKLVAGLEHLLFFHILGIVIPTDDLIFVQRVRYTTNQSTIASPKFGPVYWTRINMNPASSWWQDFRCSWYGYG